MEIKEKVNKEVQEIVNAEPEELMNKIRRKRDLYKYLSSYGKSSLSIS